MMEFLAFAVILQGSLYGCVLGSSPQATDLLINDIILSAEEFVKILSFLCNASV